MRRVGYVVMAVLIGLQSALAQPTTKPSPAKASATRPARDEPPERELNDQEKKALNAALLEARKARIPGAESLQRDIENALAAAKKKYDDDSAVALKDLKRAQG